MGFREPQKEISQNRIPDEQDIHDQDHRNQDRQLRFKEGIEPNGPQQQGEVSHYRKMDPIHPVGRIGKITDEFISLVKEPVPDCKHRKTQ